MPDRPWKRAVILNEVRPGTKARRLMVVPFADWCALIGEDGEVLGDG